MLTTSIAWSDISSHARLYLSFCTDQPRNPWHMLAESLGYAEPRLKITGLTSVCVFYLHAHKLSQRQMESKTSQRLVKLHVLQLRCLSYDCQGT